ncbi:MAG: hypothetical protein NC093_09880 [Alistipes sp.]|nr:hypothetical protein [Alistipes sp.]
MLFIEYELEEGIDERRILEDIKRIVERFLDVEDVGETVQLLLNCTKEKNNYKVVSETEVYFNIYDSLGRKVGVAFREERKWENFLETDYKCSDSTLHEESGTSIL